MKRFLIIQILGFVLLAGAGAQKVDSIKVEQTGDYIRIAYKLLNSRQGEIYRVRALVSIDGGPNIELRSVSGDTGDNVQGGKPEYFIVWDVLKDMNELRSAEFIVRAEMFGKPGRIRSDEKRSSLMPVIQIPGPGFGARYSYLGKMGFSVQYTNSKTEYLPSFNTRPDSRISRVSLGMTFRVLNSEDSQMHMMLGSSIGQVWIREEWTNVFGNTGEDYKLGIAPGFEGGLLICMKNTLLMFSAAKQLPDLTEDGDPMSKHTFIAAGFGIRF